MIFAIAFLSSIAILTYHNLARPGITRGADDSPIVVALADAPVRNLHLRMVRSTDPDAPCPVADGIALVDTEALGSDVWGCLRVVNASATSGVWRIDMGDVTAVRATWWVRRAAEDQPVLTNRAETGIRERETGTRRVVSLPIPIMAGETIEIWASFDLAGLITGSAPMLRPELQLDAEMMGRSHLYGGLLAGSALLILFFTAFAYLLQSRPARLYAVYFGIIWLTMAAREGYVAALVPYNAGQIINGVSVIVVILLSLAHYRFVAAFVEDAAPGHEMARVGGRLVRLALWAILAVVVFVLGVIALIVLMTSGVVPIEDPDGLYAGMIAASALVGQAFGGAIFAASLLYALWAAVLLWRLGTDGSGFFAAGVMVLVLGVALVARNLPAAAGIDAIWTQSVVNVLWFTDAMIFAAAIVRQTFGLRNQRDIAREAELAASQEQLRLSQTLLAAHRDLDRARTLAEQHRSRLALTSHDLRQPLMSLRLALEEAEAAPAALKERLSTGLDYLRSVLTDSMVAARPSDIDAGHGPAPAREAIPVSVLTQNVVRMFGDEARAKGLTLRAAPSGLIVEADPVPLIRMLSNLTSNAVKYTDAGAVVIGARRRNGRIALEVRDSGPGMSADEVAAVRGSYARGAQSHAAEGEGVGLASVEALAIDHGLSLVIRSAPGRGTTMAIEGLREAPPE
ncbi:sensor histidine kinase [Roseibacterium sp. SDUM158016]|uniref:sensor histidine kinase n=1 Tax=Roseicyclus sediminis TaxID=2980997 RepID=UPI0021CEE730|nr:sensor histidine kinase [Roseibacterium sp. SDUM158016]MCU4653440.1 sensor histidine kinase [Roseibacterium sp. SDUM158016]